MKTLRRIWNRLRYGHPAPFVVVEERNDIQWLDLPDGLWPRALVKQTIRVIASYEDVATAHQFARRQAQIEKDPGKIFHVARKGRGTE